MNLNEFIPFLEKLGSDTELADKASLLKTEIEKLSSSHFADIKLSYLPLETQ